MAGIPESYETDDIYLGAYFMLCGCHLDHKRRNGQKVLFTFSNPTGSITELRSQFYMGAVGKLHDYSQKVVAMKQLLFD
jgi:hypothetical protein